ncbi:gamma-type small acid-soluble spore protein [Virgibacillus dokdonensis]|uniref:Small, acid-soluble spore protein gamma-type n=2 Tax=Virgibacillus TaxID=84406 RepID=A0A2K9J5R2_9BACI|nr:MULTISPECIES: gamma-type small acid-soluble spore protein [Virgibacillus]AUJ25451.1 Small, acid-soluble spore protein gamma-type [Virgibacillus dokdonensis]NWO13127.1 gamma-type small acid-soluble spore protein [Virgibacillus sp.]RFA36035.1 gamma-type small acid-soluble spore protein [Virgibacillus dokdonensis]SHH81577.1 small acid-soluble spore protein E (minor gamma-type SASP) [Virgibacillus chiguensis]
MAKKQQPNQTSTGTNIQKVKQQNQQAAQGQGQYGTEYGAEQTNAQEVRKQNQKSQQNKK